MRRTLPILLTLAVVGCGATNDVGDIPALDQLTETYGCGTGFWLGNPNQTVALRLGFAGDGPPDRVTELPAEGWTAEVIDGQNLYANWCDDVIEPGEPEPLVVRRLPITAGTLTLEGPIPEPFEGGMVTVDATGLEVTLPDGSVVELGDIEIVNGSYGFFAG